MMFKGREKKTIEECQLNSKNATQQKITSLLSKQKSGQF